MRESLIAQQLRILLAPVLPGAAIPTSAGLLEFQAALEVYLPSLLGWPHESLDGFRFSIARKLADDQAEFIGLALLLKAQAWIPCYVSIKISPEDAIVAIDCRIGERDASGSMLTIPYGSSKVEEALLQLPRRLTEIRWAWQVQFGEMV